MKCWDFIPESRYAESIFSLTDKSWYEKIKTFSIWRDFDSQIWYQRKTDYMDRALVLDLVLVLTFASIFID